MKNLFYSILAKITGRNFKATPKEVIVDQMNEPRSLPMGRKAFEEWSDRIISGALISGGEDDLETFIQSQKFALADLIMHLGPTESCKSDAFFIHSLRKFAINQVADAMRRELRDKAKAKLKAKEQAKEEEASLEKGYENLKANEQITTIQSRDQLAV